LRRYLWQRGPTASHDGHGGQTDAVTAELRDRWRDEPHPRRLSESDRRRAEILRRHRDAIAGGVSVYVDPTSGLSVFTADFLASRGYCCESGCRHCPFVL
jgi:hypothetical protein